MLADSPVCGLFHSLHGSKIVSKPELQFAVKIRHFGIIMSTFKAKFISAISALILHVFTIQEGNNLSFDEPYQESGISSQVHPPIKENKISTD